MRTLRRVAATVFLDPRDLVLNLVCCSCFLAAVMLIGMAR